MTAPSAPTIRTILLPLDGSPRAGVAIPAAIALAKATGAKVSLLHVVEHDAPREVHGETHLASVAEAQAYLADIARRFADAGIATDSHVHDEPQRDIVRSIAAHAEEAHADLAILTAHGRGGWRNLLFGRVAQQVALNGDCPALVLPDRDTADVPFAPTLIAVLLEGPHHEEGEAALPAAVALAQATGAAIRLITVVATQRTDTRRGPIGALLPSTTRALLDIEEQASVAHLEEHLAEILALGVPATAAVVRGDPADDGVAEATRCGAGVLAIVTHPRSGLAGMLSGSVGARALARFPGALLIARSPDEVAGADA
jgi:nucleotide-binding universal stress UspA family protein